MFIDELSEKERLYIWRRRNKIKLKEVADYLGVATATVSKFENGKLDYANIHEGYKKFIYLKGGYKNEY